MTDLGPQLFPRTSQPGIGWETPEHIVGHNGKNASSEIIQCVMYGDAKIIQNLRFLLLYTYFYAAPNDTVNIGELCMTGTLQWLRVDLLLPHPVWNLDSAMCAKYRVICYIIFLRTFKQIEVYQATSKVASLHGWLLGYSCIFLLFLVPVLSSLVPHLWDFAASYTVHIT